MNFIETEVATGIYVSGGKENAALETTGRSSRCFDHGKEKIWVLKQCNLKIPFVGLGAGCYPVTSTFCFSRAFLQICLYISFFQHLCKNGSVWFTLLNGTVEKRCLKAGHVIQIRRVEYRSLHIGSVVCPPCEDVCGVNQKLSVFNFRKAHFYWVLSLERVLHL